MGHDLSRRTEKPLIKPCAQGFLLFRRHARLPSLPSIDGEDIPSGFVEGLEPTPDRVIIEVKELCNLRAGLSFVQKQLRICPTGYPMIFSLAANAAFDTLFGSKKIWHYRTSEQNSMPSIRQQKSHVRRLGV